MSFFEIQNNLICYWSVGAVILCHSSVINFFSLIKILFLCFSLTFDFFIFCSFFLLFYILFFPVFPSFIFLKFYMLLALNDTGKYCYDLNTIYYYVKLYLAIHFCLHLNKFFYSFLKLVPLLTVTNMMFMVLDICLPAWDFISDIILTLKYWFNASFDWVEHFWFIEFWYD